MNRSIELAQPTGALLPDANEFQMMMNMAEQVAKSGLVPGVDSAAGVITLMQTGRELGIEGMAAIRGIHIIQGRPTPSAALIDALIRRDHGGGALRITELTAKSCTVRYRRREWQPDEWDELTYTIDDAKQAGYLTGPNKHNWNSKPKNMLRARAISEVARMAFADSLMGMYSGVDAGPMIEMTPDERMQRHMKPDQEEMLDELVSDIVDAEVREVGDVITDPPSSDNEYQSYVATGDLETDYTELMLRLRTAPDMVTAKQIWNDIARAKLANDDELRAVRDEQIKFFASVEAANKADAQAEDQAVTA